MFYFKVLIVSVFLCAFSFVSHIFYLYSMHRPNRFRKTVIETLAKRAAYLCTNPNCKVPTTGQALNITGSITIGECAHIYGAEESSARYDPFMSAEARRNITNAIWLCRNCHKLVDTDVDKYPAELLLKWKHSHEEEVAGKIGKIIAVSDKLIDRQDGWEYIFAAEQLKDKLAPIIARWESLTDGLYAKSTIRIPKKDSFTWLEDQLNNLKQQVMVLNLVVNREFKIAFGEPGVQGSEAAIIAACNLFVEGCQRLLEWEENIQFSLVHKSFQDYSALFKGIGSHILKQFVAIPNQLLTALNENKKEIIITIHLPDEFIVRAARGL